MAEARWGVVAAGLVGLAVGYLAGREHAKRELADVVNAVVVGLSSREREQKAPIDFAPVRSEGRTAKAADQESEREAAARRAAEAKAAEERGAEERRTAAARAEVEQRAAAEEQRKSERRAAREREAEARRLADERRAADERAAHEREEAEKRAAKEKAEGEKRAKLEECERYMREKVELYEVRSKYQDDVLDGRVACVFGKLKNKGDRSLKKVKIVAYFLDSNGRTIFEEDYRPINTAAFSMNGENKPLKAGYIKELGYKAKGCPSEWAEGRVRVSVTEIEFEE